MTMTQKVLVEYPAHHFGENSYPGSAYTAVYVSSGDGKAVVEDTKGETIFRVENGPNYLHGPIHRASANHGTIAAMRGGRPLVITPIKG